MNFLAHFYLSSGSETMIVGSFLGDFVKGDLRKAASPYQEGIRLHRTIDATTDAHPAVKRSKARLLPSAGHYSAVLVDVFYDHLLASTWERWSHEPLETFAQRVYHTLTNHRAELPDVARWVADNMREDDWLTSYREIGGIHTALEKMSRRLKRPFALHSATPILERDRLSFLQEFEEVFENLRALAPFSRTRSRD
ncbi:MAG TPA: ACP phosphodiesterase [Thermoanaerobaculia bacterium]|nr:ACP phosphodiesterase [Thermoanaerobaculia bacterium]